MWFHLSTRNVDVARPDYGSGAAHLNMTDPDQQCPPNWRLITSPVRACGRLTSTFGPSCDSAVFPSNGVSFSLVCGRVIAYQKGSVSAFFPSLEGRSPGLEGVYIEGVSLTRGPAGSRQHIWSFANALFENNNGVFTAPNYCSCTDTRLNWPFQLPSFIGNDYFCDTGNVGPDTTVTDVYSEDPLWDGNGCGPTSSCCQFNNPPWFCKTLAQSTAEDIELRICADEDIGNEDTYIALIDIYTM